MADKTYDIVINAQTQKAIGNITRLGSSLRALAGIAAVAVIADQMKDLALKTLEATKQYERYNNQLALITKTETERAGMLRVLEQTAAKNRTGVAETIDLYSKLRLTTQDMNVSNAQVLEVTSKFSKALALSGADAGTAAGAIRQFNQAMASGTVRGDEFNSIVEAMGPALSIMAQESGIGIGKLREMSQAGELTAPVFFKMIEQSTALEEKFALTAKTTEQLEIELSDVFTGYLADSRAATAITDAYTMVLESLISATKQLRGVTSDQLEQMIEMAMQRRADAKGTDDHKKAITSYEAALDRATKTATKFSSVQAGTPLERAQSRLTELEIALDLYNTSTGKGVAATGKHADTFRTLIVAMRATEDEITNIKKVERDRAQQVIEDNLKIAIDAQKQLADRQRTFTDMQRMQAAEAKGTGYIEAAQQQYNDTVREAREIFKDQVTLQQVLQNAEAERMAQVLEGTRLVNEEAARLKQQEITDFINAEETKRNEALKTQQYQLMLQGLSAQDASAAAQNIMKYEEDKTGFLIGQGKNFFDAFKDQSKEAFMAYKAFAIAQTIMDTYKAAMSAYASLAPIPFIGPALGAAAAVAAVGFGMQQVNAIRSQSYSGREFGGPVTGGSSYIVGERGPEMFTPQGNGTITPNNQLGTNSGANITFNINATDADGFDELLITRRPLIVGMVQEAMNRQGSSL